MPDRKALQELINGWDGWSLTAAGVQRGDGGHILADVSLANGDLKDTTRLALTDPAARDGWLARVKGNGRPSGEAIGTALLDLTKQAQAQLQGVGEEEGRAKGQATVLTELALANGVELWHAPDQTPWLTITVDGHREHWPIQSGHVRRWLSRLFFEVKKQAPGAQATADAQAVLSGKALFEGSEHRVYVRLAEHDGAIWLDLADDRWRAVKVTATGWEIVEQPEVRFRRPASMKPLVEPTRGGSLLAFFDHFDNLPAKSKERLAVISWLVASLLPGRPFPILAVNGDQGAGKSTLVAALVETVDPNAVALGRPPDGERDLFIRANSRHIVTFENVSHISPELSDALCALATGGGYSVRRLYTDAEEEAFQGSRPIILNGIGDLAVRPDLLDRSLIVTLPERRKFTPESDWWAAFRADLPAILGGLLDAAVRALRDRDHVTGQLPRMADAARWVAAAAPSFGSTAKKILDAWNENRSRGQTAALAGTPIMATLWKLVKEAKEPIEATPTELFNLLNTSATSDDRRLPGWPKAANALSAILSRYRAALRNTGIEVVDKEVNGQRHIRLEKVQKGPAPSAPNPDLDRNNGQKVGADLGAGPQARPAPPAPGFTPKISRRDELGADGADLSATHSKTCCVDCEHPATHRGGDGHVRCQTHALIAPGGLSQPIQMVTVAEEGAHGGA